MAGNTKSYTGQKRGGQSDYDRYFAGMDVTMKQKLAFIGAHFLMRPGAVIADMGCGSGLGSYQLALLNPHITVVGIDINGESVRIAREKYKLPNLRFEVGDIETPNPDLGPFDGVLNSSVLHHVYSFNGYNRANVVNALRNQFACMNWGGQMIIRDFVAWPEDRHVLLDVSTKGTGNTLETMSDADLLIRFSETARPLTPEKGPGFFLEDVAGAAGPEWQRFRLSAKYANEFILRKNYRRDWGTEVLEEYGWWTAEDYRREIRALGGRVSYTAPFWNSWIVENWFRGKVMIWNEDGSPAELPPTNFIAIAEKVAPEESLYVGERAISRQPKNYLSLKSFRNRRTGEIYDMAARPGEVRDYLPYLFDENGRLRIFAKHGYPRPLANIVPRGTPVLDQKQWSGHMVEIQSVALDDATRADEEKALQTLAKRMGVECAALGHKTDGLRYYPSPGLSSEYVTSAFINLSEGQSQDATRIDPALSGFSTAGDVRGYLAQDILRAAQVGMLPEARLELNVYALLRHLGYTPDVWIGSEMPARPAPLPVQAERLEDMLDTPAVKAFTKSSRPAHYIRHLRSVFADASAVRENARQEFEFIVPGKEGTSMNVASVLPLVLGNDAEWYVGLESRDLPAPQSFEGNSRLPVAPAYRLPNKVGSVDAAAQYIADRFNTERAKVRSLGEGYFSSIGLTPERIFPLVAFVDPEEITEKLHFVPLRETFAQANRLRDGHLLIAVKRGVHALGLWNDYIGAAPEPRAV